MKVTLSFSLILKSCIVCLIVLFGVGVFFWNDIFNATLFKRRKLIGITIIDSCGMSYKPTVTVFYVVFIFGLQRLLSLSQSATRLTNLYGVIVITILFFYLVKNCVSLSKMTANLFGQLNFTCLRYSFFVKSAVKKLLKQAWVKLL